VVSDVVVVVDSSDGTVVDSPDGTVVGSAVFSDAVVVVPELSVFTVLLVVAPVLSTDFVVVDDEALLAEDVNPVPVVVEAVAYVARVVLVPPEDDEVGLFVGMT
jgi:hypothetical protein